MKLIISRKGFDSSFGGVASPIMPDGRLVPFPIPASNDPSSYADVMVNGVAVGEMVEVLTSGKITRSHRCHLDPDIDAKSLKRVDGWRPAFGQDGAAQGHLENQGVESGDLFLFFGWFRQVERVGKGWRYMPGAPDLQVLYGWLQIGQIVRLGQGQRPKQAEAFSMHPHIARPPSQGNTLYLAGDRLELGDTAASGAGLFGHVTNSRILTDRSQRNRSQWLLPVWMHPSNGSTLSYHLNPDRWRLEGNACVAQSVAKGQEFVLRPGNIGNLRGWINELFEE